MAQQPLTPRQWQQALGLRRELGMAKIRATPIPNAAYGSLMVRGAKRASAKREMLDAYYGKPGFEDLYNSWAPLSFSSKMRDYKRNLAVAMQSGAGRRGRRRR